MGDKVRVIELVAENVKRLKAVSVSPKRNVNIVAGKNGQGKSSLLDSLMYALGGRSTIPGKPVRKGKDQATISIDLGDYTVEKRIKADGNEYLKVKGPDGKKISKPQKFLDDLCGKMGLAFDPVDFMNKSSGEQAKILMDVLGLDFDSLNDERETLYMDRRIKSKLLKDLISSVEKAKEKTAEHDNVKPVDVSKLSQKLIKLNKELASVKRAGFKIKELSSKISNNIDLMSEYRAEIKRLTAIGIQLKEDNENMSKDIESLKEKQEDDSLILEDISSIEDKLENASELNAIASQLERVSEMEKEMSVAEKGCKKLNDRINEIDKEKLEAVESADFPIKGLEFSSEGVMYKGVPLEQASQSEKIKVSMAIAFSMNSDLKIALIRDGSLLDGANMSLLKKLAEKYDAQVWIERVAENSDGCHLYIEDGEVVEEK